MSPDLIAFLLDALPWLVLAVTLGYLVGRFGCPLCGGHWQADVEDGPRDTSSRGVTHDRPERGGDRGPMQRSMQDSSNLRFQRACMTDADAFACHVERLSASRVTPPRVAQACRDPRLLH